MSQKNRVSEEGVNDCGRGRGLAAAICGCGHWQGPGVRAGGGLLGIQTNQCGRYGQRLSPCSYVRGVKSQQDLLLTVM